MFTNYIKVAIRNLKKYKGYSSINILGLSIGLASAILILLWVLDEISYDKFNKNYKRIYRVILLDETYKENRSYSVTPPALADAMKSNFPEVLRASRFNTENNLLVSYSENKINTELGFTDPSFFEIFTVQFIKGNPTSALLNTNSIVITEKIAKKLLGDEDPLNKIIRIDNQYDFIVSAVIKDMPSNSKIQFDVLIPFENIENMTGNKPDSWDSFGYQTYLLLNNQTNISEFNNKISNFLLKSHTYTWIPKLYVQPLKNIHLYDINGGGIIVYIYIFSFIAAFILLLACINFMNLTTARASIRSKEIGLRKVIGATKWKLLLQFYSESILTSILALFISLILVFDLLPIFNDLTGKTLSLSAINNYQLYILISGITLLTGLVAGSYPAIYLSSLQPIKTLKNSLNFGSFFVRKVLVIFQFSLSISLITATIVVSNQMDFIRKQNLGFNKDQIIMIPLNQELRAKFNVVKNELQQNPQVLSVCETSSKIGLGRFFSVDLNKWEGNNGENSLLLNVISASPDFLKTFDIKTKSGRFFSKEFISDSNGVILNETAVKELGLTNPIGKYIFVHESKNTVLGIVKDFNFQSLRSNIKPLAIFLVPDWYKYVAVKIKPNDISSTLDFIKNKAENIAPSYPFEYQFLDEEFDGLYRSELRMGKIFNYFSILAIIISSLGLFGLSIFMIAKKVKEIAIRKVVGASVFNLVILNLKEFIKWILIANIVAFPITYFAMNYWLQSFAYKTDISSLAFMLSGSITLLVAVVTVVFQIVKAALINPVESLKYE